MRAFLGMMFRYAIDKGIKKLSVGFYASISS